MIKRKKMTVDDNTWGHTIIDAMKLKITSIHAELNDLERVVERLDKHLNGRKTLDKAHEKVV